MTSREPDWVRFESRDDSASAAMLRSQLENEGVATRVEIHGVPGLSSFNILVPRGMLHRARSITEQQPPSDTELELMATGRLSSERLLLRPAVVEDAEPIALAASATNPQRILALLNHNSRWWQAYGYGVWAILDRNSEDHLGWCGLRPGETPSEPELLYGLKPSARGCGLVAEAARAVLGFAFSLPWVRSVWAATGVDNAASVAVMERIGMSFERRGILEGVESLIYRVRKTGER